MEKRVLTPVMKISGDREREIYCFGKNERRRREKKKREGGGGGKREKEIATVSEPPIDGVSNNVTCFLEVLNQMVAMESSGLMKPTACLQSRFLEALGEHNTITAGGGGEGAGSAAGEEAALRRELQNHLQLEMAQRERDSLHDAIRSKDAEIERLRRLAYGLEVIDVEAGVTRIVVEEAGLRASQPWKRMRKEQAARGRVIGALQEQLVKVKKEHVEERVARH